MCCVSDDEQLVAKTFFTFFFVCLFCNISSTHLKKSASGESESEWRREERKNIKISREYIAFGIFAQFPSSCFRVRCLSLTSLERAAEGEHNAVNSMRTRVEIEKLPHTREGILDIYNFWCVSVVVARLLYLCKFQNAIHRAASAQNMS